MARDSARPVVKEKDPVTSFKEWLLNEQIKEPEYSDDEQKYLTFIRTRMTKARNMREQPHPEFNGMTYTQNYQSNALAANSYTPPRVNPEDTNVVTGTTREKILAIVSAVLNLNFESTVRPFDKNNIEDIELGEGMTDCVDASNKQELWDDKKMYVYYELAVQGDVFMEDLHVDEVRLDKKRIKISDVTKETFKDFSWKDAVKTTVFSGCKRNIIPGIQVYFGNIRERQTSMQPYMFTREVVPYEIAKASYGHLPRWENVPKTLYHSDAEQDSVLGINWRVEGVEDGMVEILKYQDKWNDDYQICLNGVMQLPVGFPMPWEFGDYNIVHGSLEPISAFFLYGKSIPAKTKLDQEILDEMYKLAVLKNQKSLMPPIANYSANILTQDMFLPAAINNNLNKGDIEVMGGDPGSYAMKSSEFQMIEMVKKFIDEKSVNPILQGDSPSGNPTATEVSTVSTQAKQRLGLIIFGFIQLHTNLDLLRLYVILENYTKPTGTILDKTVGQVVEKFRTVTVDKQIEGRGMGVKKVEFTEDRLAPKPLFAREEGMELDEEGEFKRDETGRLIKNPPRVPQKIMQISPSTLRQVKMRWYVEVTPTDKETSMAEKIRFEDSLVKAAKLFGLQSINLDYAKQRWAVHNRENPNYFFVQQSAAVPTEEDINSIDSSAMEKSIRANPTGVREAVRQGYGA